MTQCPTCQIAALLYALVSDAEGHYLNRSQDERDHPNEFEDGTLVIVRYHLGEEGIEVLVSLGDVVVA